MFFLLPLRRIRKVCIMKKKLNIALFLVVFSVTALAGRPARVIITAGQSNTDGRCPNAELPSYIKALAKDTVKFSRGAYNYCLISQNRTDGRFESFWPKATKDGAENSWAYDAVTYLWLDQLVRDKFYVIKWAVGGTSVQADKKSETGKYWYADASWLKRQSSTAQGGQSLLKSLTEQIDACIDQTLSGLKDGYQIDALLWHQGESDYKQGKAYYRNLKAVFAYIRNHLTVKTGTDYSQLPIIIGTVSERNRCFSPEVDKAMRRLASEDEHLHLIDMHDASLLADRLHFDPSSAETLGVKMYDKLLRIAYRTAGVVPSSEGPLAGKRIAFLGDSYVRNHREPAMLTWHYKFAEKYGMTYFNYGRNGSNVAYNSVKWGPAMYVRYKDLPADLDYVVVVGGHNDSYALDSIGGLEGYKRRLGELCKGLIERYPTAQLFFFTRWVTADFADSDARQVVDATLEVCGNYGIPVFDSARRGGIYIGNETFRKIFLQPKKGNTDTAHLNARGHERFLPVAENFLLQYMLPGIADRTLPQ